MDSQHEVPTESVIVDSSLPTTKNKGPKPPLSVKPIKPTKTRRGNIFLSFFLLLLGIMLGVLATLLFAFSFSHDNAPISTPVSTKNTAITVQISNAYLTQLVSKKLKTAGLTGDISNVQVTLVNNQIIISGNDRFQLFVFSVTRRFTIPLQPYIRSCQPQVHIIHAALANIPVTTFVTNYEDQINQQIQLQSSDLPSGFTYCAVDVRTEPNAMIIMYSATPS